jgi:CRP-like cAMP-binding protein
VVNTLGPGAYFGEIGLVEGIPRTATVAATSRCHLYRISGTAFLFALNSAPMIYGPLRESMAARLARTHPMHELTKTPGPA